MGVKASGQVGVRERRPGTRLMDAPSTVRFQYQGPCVGKRQKRKLAMGKQRIRGQGQTKNQQLSPG